MTDPLNPATFDLAIILTAAGATVAAGIIASIIQVLKRTPQVGVLLDAGREGFLATVLSGALVVYAFAALAVPINLTSLFMGFLAFLNIAGLAGKAYDVAPDKLKSALGGTQ